MVNKRSAVEAGHIDQAIGWLVKLKHSEITADQQRAFQQWLQACPDHERAWQSVSEMEAPLAADALARADGRRQQQRVRRRQLVKMLGLSGMAVGLGWLGRRELPWQCWVAGHRTAVGEQGALQLADGSKVLMNTDTALNLYEGGEATRIDLLRGEIQVDASPGAPLRVTTAGGAVEGCNSRFIVRAYRSRSCVFLGEGRLRLVSAGGRADVGDRSGESWWLSPERVQPRPGGTGHDPQSWTEGVISAREMPLDSLLGEMSRYRSGFISCAGAVSGRRVSGIFQTTDIDQALVFLARSQNLRLSWRSPYWAYLTAA